MNITRALTAALPEIPARAIAQRYPRLDPGFTFKEHLDDGERVVRVYIPSVGAMYKFPPQNWALIQLFDGKRTCEEVAALYSQQTGTQYTAEAIRDFADELEAAEFWYKTSQEKNISLMQKSKEERRRLLKTKSRYGDLSEILFPALNPDKFLTWLNKCTSFIYTLWFTLVTLAAFAFSAAITITHWSEIGRDTLEFYNFSHKTWGDVALLYFIFLWVGGLHEIGHGHACKHYGGRVPAMGFGLIYLAPCFYTDTTEGEVHATRYQRLVISVAGVWVELMVYAVATPIWWGTPPDTPVHNGAYFLMLITGIAAVLVNWNPLIKLDGYFMLCEILGIGDLKEDSTAYVSGWVKRHIWGLPVEVPYVPKRRRFGYVVYALLSGFYSYTVLYVVARFVGNVFRNFNPEWSFIPELATAALIFRSRIRLLVNFMKFVYLDKKDGVRAWFTPRRSLAVAVCLGAFLLVPLRHDAVVGRFILEPTQRFTMRAEVPGVVTDVYADEGKQVEAGAPVVRLRNLPLQSRLARSESEYMVASGRTVSATLRYDNLGPAIKERESLAQQTSLLLSEAANLEIKSPISGTVLTPRVTDRLGASVTAGTELLEIADLTQLRARIYVSEHDLYKLRVGSRASLEIAGIPKQWDARAVAISPLSTEIDPGLGEQVQYKGLRPPNFYAADLIVVNSEWILKPGMAGTARIYAPRMSIAGFAWQEVSNFLGRKVW
jgi:putative peptide zinc metalloprotease protein